MKATLIDWSDELVDLLFYHVLSSGAHIAPRDKKPQRTQNGTCACSFEEAHATVVVAYREVQ